MKHTISPPLRVVAAGGVAAAILAGGGAVALASGSGTTTPAPPSSSTSSSTAPAPKVHVPHLDGTVTSANGSDIVIKDRDGFTRSITTSGSTTYSNGLTSAPAVGTQVHATGTVDANGTALDATTVGTPPTPPAGGHGKHGPGAGTGAVPGSGARPTPGGTPGRGGAPRAGRHPGATGWAEDRSHPAHGVPGAVDDRAGTDLLTRVG